MNLDAPKTFHFVRRKVTDEENRELRLELDPKGFYPAGNPRDWIVDEQHDIKFASLGGRGDHPAAHEMMPDFYLLLVGKKIIRFESRYIIKTVEKTDSIKHEVFNVQCPMALSNRADWLHRAIEEALFADWHSRSEGKWYTVADVATSSFEFKFV